MNALSIDIGGSKIVTGIVSSTGEVFNAEKTQLPSSYDFDFLLNMITEKALALLESHEVDAVGIVIPALCDAERGLWVYSPFSGISNIPISDILSERLHKPVYIDNDVNLCAIAEREVGCCKDCDDFLWVTVSNGIGGGLYLNGKLFGGSNACAAEIGHIVVDENGPLCGCGNVGCLEVCAAGPAILRYYLENNPDPSVTSTVQVADLARGGDTNALSAFEKAGRYIGIATAAAINITNVRKVVYGGGVSQAFELLEPHIESAMRCRIFKQANPSVYIQKTVLGYNAALIGAGVNALIRLNAR